MLIKRAKIDHANTKSNIATPTFHAEKKSFAEFPSAVALFTSSKRQDCVNDRLKQHAASLRTVTSGQLAVHVSDCGCQPVISEN